MYLENERIKLRAPEPEDLDVFYKWENDTDLWAFGSTLVPYSRYELKQYISSSRDIYEARQVRFIIEKKPELKIIGSVDLYDYEPHHARAAVGILIDLKYQKQGFANETLFLICEYAFSFLKMHQLYAYIPVGNKPSKKLFERCGFKTKGVFPEWIRTTDGYEDVQLVSLIPGL